MKLYIEFNCLDSEYKRRFRMVHNKKGGNVILSLSHVVSWVRCIDSWVLPSFLLLQLGM